MATMPHEDDVHRCLEDVASDRSAWLVADKWGISVHEVDDLRRWPLDKRAAVVEWLLRR